MPEWHVYRKQVSSDLFISVAYFASMLCFSSLSLPYYDSMTCSGKEHRRFFSGSIGINWLASPCKELSWTQQIILLC